MVTDVGSTKRRLLDAIDDPRFVGGHPIAGAETSGVEHARADLFQDAVWYLTPTETHLRAPLRAPAPAAEGPGSAPGGARRRDPRPARGGVQPPAARARQRAGAPGRRRGCSTRARRCARWGRASATPPAWPAPTPPCGPTSTAPTGRRWWRRCGASPARSTRWPTCSSPTATWRGWNDAARDDRRRLLEADLTGRPVHELQADGSQPPRYRRPGGAGTRASRGEHRGHDARAGLRHAHRGDDALGRG